MADEENWSIIAQPGRSLACEGSTGRRVVEEMVSGALEIMQAHSSDLEPRFAIGEHLLCEPDFRQIMMWAEELGWQKEQVLQGLFWMPDEKRPWFFWADEGAEVIDSGRLRHLVLNRDVMPVSCRRWVCGLKLETLVILGGKQKPLLKLHLDNIFTLKTLNCCDQGLVELDLRGVSRLRELSCSDNFLERLDLSGCSELRTLSCCRNRLKNLDLSSNHKIVSVQCYDNQIENLNTASALQLKKLLCNKNCLEELSLSTNPSLDWLWCSSNKIPSLDLSINRCLSWLWVDESTALSPSKFPLTLWLRRGSEMMNANQTSSKYNPSTLRWDRI